MRDPRTPLLARYFALFVIGYALSPIDLIPDFIPVLGMLDDLILLPLGIALLRQMIPSVVMVASRRQAEALMRSGLPASRNAAMVIMAICSVLLLMNHPFLRVRLIPKRCPINKRTKDKIEIVAGSASRLISVCQSTYSDSNISITTQVVVCDYNRQKFATILRVKSD